MKKDNKELPIITIMYYDDAMGVTEILLPGILKQGETIGEFQDALNALLARFIEGETNCYMTCDDPNLEENLEETNDSDNLTATDEELEIERQKWLEEEENRLAEEENREAGLGDDNES